MRDLHQFYIGGSWAVPNSAQKLEVLNPATEAPCLSMACANDADIEAAIAAARKAAPAWSKSAAQTRQDFLLAAADIMEQRKDDFIDAHVMCMGIPRHQAWDYQVAAPIEAMRYYASLCAEVEAIHTQDNITTMQEAIGVCVLINPWNYPLLQMVGKVAPALAAGCTVIAKPAEQTPLPDVIMAEIFEAIGLPAGVFNLIMGIGANMGPALCAHDAVDMVSFTGSTRAGIEVAQAAAPSVKRVCQELGGKSALIITEDTDFHAAIDYGVHNVMLMGGQTCDALTRMLVPASRYDEAVSIAKGLTEALVMGDPLDPNTDIGPLASLGHRDRVVDYIKLGIAEGAQLITGGPQHPEHCPKGAYVQPTIFGQVRPDMRIAREEIFGPVLCIIAYDDIAQAIAIANDSVFGLSSAVYAKDKASAMMIARHMQSGQCFIQGGVFSVQAPFGGYKQSGNGREWGKAGLHEYLETKAIISG